MSAVYKIDLHNKLIITSWSGDVIDSELIDALTHYQQNIKSRPEYRLFDEIVDFSNANKFHLSSDGIERLVRIGASGDSPETTTRLAVVVSSQVAFGLARMYETYRSLVPSGTKVMRVFKNYNDALEWIANKTS
jgi:hypothetical protein